MTRTIGGGPYKAYSDNRGTLLALRRLELLIGQKVEGLLQGEHLGLLPGAGSELDTGREYQAGDDVRRIDWAVTARTTVPHVRDTVADRELTTWVLVDATASMDFGTAEREKRDLAVGALAAVGMLTSGGGNRLGVLLHQGGAPVVMPDRYGRAHLLAVLGAVTDAPRTPAGGGATGLAGAVEALHRTARRRGLAVIVSDFHDPGWEAPLRRLSARHQVLAVEVSDPREAVLPDVGMVTLTDPETGRRRVVSSSDGRLRRRFAHAAAQRRAAVREGLRRAGAAHVELSTGRDWVRDLARHVTAQRRLVREGVRR